MKTQNEHKVELDKNIIIDNRWKVFKYDEVDSTNEKAKQIRKVFSGRFIVTANMQTAGRGQYGRKWVSPAGENFLATFAVPKNEVNVDNIISFAAANAVCKLLEKYRLDTQCKWPNDIEINNRKIAGILIEKVDDWVLIGIGLNINWPTKVSELENGKNYTSIFAESGKKIDKDNFISLLSDLLYFQLKRPLNETLELYNSYWNNKRNIEIFVDNNWVPAKQKGIDSDGSLIAESAPGNIIKINTSALVRTDVI